MNSAAVAVSDDDLSRLQSYVSGMGPSFLADLADLVNIDCGSYTKAGVDAVGTWVADFLDSLGSDTVRIGHDQYGDTVVGRFSGSPSGPAVLLLAHMDTVFDAGTAAARPFRTDSGRAYGPGVADMKAGLLAGLYAIRTLQSALTSGASEPRASLPFRRLVFVANSDEEIGSYASTPIIQEYARDSDLALVLECARANGDIVSSRKGLVDCSLLMEGRAAHSGLEPEKGSHAILEAAFKTSALQAINGRWEGVTVNVGKIEGGTRPNVIPERARLDIDVRAPTRESLQAADAEVQSICEGSAVPGVSCRIVEHHRQWPMEKLIGAESAIEQLQAIATRLGFQVADASTGGVSDANTTASMGVPTLDGLGPVGGNDHSEDEYVELESIVPRTTLLAALLLSVARDTNLVSARDAARSRL